MRSFGFLLSCTLALLICCKNNSTGPGNQIEGKPVETRPPEAKNQQPAFPGQTRAPFRTANVAHMTRTLANGLAHPWGLAFLPDGAMLVTERPGRMRIIRSTGELSPPIA